MAQPVPQAYGYPDQTQPGVVHVYQDGGFIRMTAQSNYPAFAGAPRQNYPIMSEAPTTSGTLRVTNYETKAAKALGIAQMVLGIVAVVLGIALVSVTGDVNKPRNSFCHIGGGISFFIAGLLGVLSAIKCTMCTIISTMVLSILAALDCPTMFTFGIMAITNPYGPSNSQTSFNSHNNLDNLSANEVAVASICGILALLSVIELAISILASTYCCRAVCCGVPAFGGYRRLSNNDDALLSSPPFGVNHQVPSQARVPGELGGTMVPSSAPPLVTLA